MTTTPEKVVAPRIDRRNLAIIRPLVLPEPLKHSRELLMSQVTVSSIGYLKQQINAGAHELIADEPREAGGTDAGPDPYAFLLAALGACTSMTMQIYARRKGWPLERVAVRLRHYRMHAEDCKDCSATAGRVDQIERHISLVGALNDAQKARLLEIADRCPVHRTLTSEISIISQLD